MSAVTSFAIADKFSTRGSKITSIKLGCVSREMEKVPTFVYTVHYEYGDTCVQVNLKNLSLIKYLILYPISLDKFKNKNWGR